MRPVTSSIDGAESSSTEDGGASRPSSLPSKEFVEAAAYLACHAAAQVQLYAAAHIQCAATTTCVTVMQQSLQIVIEACQSLLRCCNTCEGTCEDTNICEDTAGLLQYCADLS